MIGPRVLDDSVQNRKNPYKMDWTAIRMCLRFCVPRSKIKKSDNFKIGFSYSVPYHSYISWLDPYPQNSIRYYNNWPPQDMSQSQNMNFLQTFVHHTRRTTRSTWTIGGCGTCWGWFSLRIQIFAGNGSCWWGIWRQSCNTQSGSPPLRSWRFWWAVGK